MRTTGAEYPELFPVCILPAINRSKFKIPIFLQNYGFSPHCYLKNLYFYDFKKKYMHRGFFSLLIIIILESLMQVLAQDTRVRLAAYNEIVTGNMQTGKYLPLIKNKNVALVVNQSSLVGKTHLADTLNALGIQIKRIFTPEHGYRGNVSEGKEIENSETENTKIEIVSLYGKKKKPATEDLKDIEAIVFDLQDVGVRFYTYISTLTFVMEACAENHIPLIVLDHPNPNGFYVDGPVLDTTYRSFVGMHPVPVVYGMTIGELAKMINGEGWLKNGIKCNLTVIPLKNYDHGMIVKLPVKPSPNLPDWRSIYLYPSLCFFEGTIVSVGRGTDKPFQIYGHPDITYGNYHFTPVAGNVNKHPKLENKTCYGENLSGYAENYASNMPKLNLSWLIKAYNNLKTKDNFFNNFFVKLAGTAELRKQIEDGLSEPEIRKSWEEDLKRFKKIREKYLMYP